MTTEVVVGDLVKFVPQLGIPADENLAELLEVLQEFSFCFQMHQLKERLSCEASARVTPEGYKKKYNKIKYLKNI